MSAFEEYVDQYGYHFNRKLYEFAVELMGGKPETKEQVQSWLRGVGVTIGNNYGHDAAYVKAMAASDYLGSSIIDDPHQALFVKDFLDDKDGYETKAFDHFVMDCRRKGIPIFWDEML